MTSDLSTTRLSRPRLGHLLAAAGASRLTTVIAPAGYGKTTLLADWVGRVPVAWHRVTADDRAAQPLLRRLADDLRAVVPTLRFEPPDVLADNELAGEAGQANQAHAMAALLCDAVSDATSAPLLLVLDDVHLIGAGDPASRLLEALCRQAPACLRVVLSSREPVPFAVGRLRRDGELLEVTAAQLTLTEREIGDLLDAIDPDLAAAVHQTTGGWPVAVRMMADALNHGTRADPRGVRQPLARSRELFDYLAREVFEHEPDAVRELVRVSAMFDRVSPDLLGSLGFPDANAVLADLVGRGLFVERLMDSPGWFGVIPLARMFVADRFPVDEAGQRDLRTRAVAWFADRGHWAEAVAVLAELRDYRRTEQLLAEHVAELLQQGGAETVIDAVARIPAAERSSTTWQVIGLAHEVRGEWGAALACLQRAAKQVGGLTPALAMRIASMHYFSSAPADALAVFEQCQLTGADPAAESRLLSVAANAHWAHGDLDASRTAASRALALAQQCGDDAALASAHTALAMIANAEGDRSKIAGHYQQALGHAQIAGDVLGEIRIRVNRSAHHVHEGDHQAALAELEVALRLADLTGFATYRALALNNRGAARLGLGQLDEAAADVHAARAVYAKAGSRLAALSLESLGEIYRLRGDRVLARTAFTEAIQLAEENSALPQLVPALTGLARLLVEDEPSAAEDLVRRALACGTGFGYPAALLAAARLALTRGQTGEVADRCAEAQRVAATRGDRAATAEALELLAQVQTDRGRARSLLDQAAVLWSEIGNPLGEIGVAVTKAKAAGGADGLAMAEAAERMARRLGARALAARAAAVAASCQRSARPSVEIKTLGGFRILRHGEPVATTAWQSKKARDLVKILVTRRGRSMTREALMAQLWPDETPERVTNRLSVALSTARQVLAPKGGSDEHGIVVNGDAVRLDPELIAVDVLTFFADAKAGLAAWQHQRSAAVSLLTTAEAVFAGDFLEEDPYADWATELREDARLTYLQVATALAEHAGETGDPVAVSRYCLRILERDCYDETAHLALIRALVAAGNHGEARRRYRTYAQRMREIEVEPALFSGSTQDTQSAGTQTA
jgi:ATP/maltotriose-dependent transcriptional regulator MalT/DNA-binding SARP family transcriptional activator